MYLENMTHFGKNTVSLLSNVSVIFACVWKDCFYSYDNLIIIGN